MNLQEFRDQIQPATEWFFDVTNETSGCGVESTDYRVSSGFHEPHPDSPSAIHREWFNRFTADMESGKIDIAALCAKRGKFDMALLREEEALRELFNRRKSSTAPSLSLHSARRLVNLSVKFLRTWEVGGHTLAKAIYEFGHAALNDPVLKIAKDLMPSNGEIAFPGYKPGQTDNDTQVHQKYSAAHGAIRAFCKANATTPVIFDIIARQEHLKAAA